METETHSSSPPQARFIVEDIVVAFVKLSWPPNDAATDDNSLIAAGCLTSPRARPVGEHAIDHLG